LEKEREREREACAFSNDYVTTIHVLPLPLAEKAVAKRSTFNKARNAP